jgi:hypothetical protein
MLALAYIRTHTKGWRQKLHKSTAVTAQAGVA